MGGGSRSVGWCELCCHHENPPVAFGAPALLLVLVITAAWWALALWPTGAAEPESLLRTRAACFGSTARGLPDARDWVLLIGEPLGMPGVLVVVCSSLW